jgi:hypothetical protein
MICALACGSVSGDELYSGSGQSSAMGGKSASGGSAPTGGSFSTGGSTGAGGSLVTGGTTTSSGGSDVSTGGVRPASGGVSSGGEPATGGAPSSGGSMETGGAGGGPPDPSTPGVVACADTLCPVEAAIPSACCLGLGIFETQCLSVIVGCGLGLGGNGQPLYCDDAADCGGGQICCVSQTTEGTTSRCEASCSGLNSGQQLCRTDSECSDGLKCSPWTRRKAYSICQ